MKARLSIILLLLLPASLYAETAEQLVERLIADVWAPRIVRVEWTFSGKPPLDLENNDNWVLASPRPLRIAGNVILSFERKDTTSGTTRKIVVTGTARIFGMSFSVRQPISSGQSVNPASLDSLELEWTYLNGDAATISDFASPKVATRGLTPGKVITTRDLRSTSLIHRGQTVNVFFADGSVRVRFQGRALKDGAVGDMIPLVSDVTASRHLRGTVISDGSIQLAR